MTLGSVTASSYGRGSPLPGGEEDPNDRVDVADESGEDGGPDSVAAVRVDAIIGRATDQLFGFDDGDAEWADASPSNARRTRPRTGQTAPKRVANPKREAEIAEILAAPAPPAEVRAYVERTDYGRVPPYMREILDGLEGEARYIMSLPDEPDKPRRIVRLLAAGERELLLRGLKQQFQQATAIYLRTGPKNRKKDELEAELESIKQDIENISRPYIFVEAGT